MMQIGICTRCGENRWYDDRTLPTPVCEECSRPPQQINRRTPGVLKVFASKQRCEIVKDGARLPRGTIGTVEPIGPTCLMLWFTPDGGSVPRLVDNYQIDEVRP